MHTPVLIGSKLMEYHGVKLNQPPNDVDLISDIRSAEKLSWISPSKKQSLLFFKDSREASATIGSSGKKAIDLVLDIHLNTENPVTSLIWKSASLLKEDDRKFLTIKLGKDLEDLVVLAIPIEWLYAIIKGHLHRIPTKFSTQKLNIQLWKKYMSHYLAIRNHCGYQKLEDELKNTEGIPYQLYRAQFDYITQTIEDTFSLEQAETDFFDDSVTRYIEHDELHKQVAIINRGTSDVLFKRFQINNDSVEMDKDLFLKATRADQINTIREELMVLFLERNLIPDVVENGAHLDDIRIKKETFLNLVCHFVCNLCGNGEYWLRQWCLDHYHLFSHYNEYPLYKMKTFALTFLKEGLLHDKPDDRQRILSLDDFMKYYEKYSENIEKKQRYTGLYDRRDYAAISNMYDFAKDCKNPIEIYGDDIILGKMGYRTRHLGKIGRARVKIDVDKIKNLWTSAYLERKEVFDGVSTLITDLISKQADEHIEKFLKLLLENCKGVTYNWSDSSVDNYEFTTLVFSNDEGYLVVYNPDNNLGLCIDEEYSNSMFFILQHEKPSYQKIRFGVCSYSLSDAAFSNRKADYLIDSRSCTYYVSDCYRGSYRDGEVSYLNKYGSTYSELESFLEGLARCYLEFNEDENSDQDDY